MTLVDQSAGRSLETISTECPSSDRTSSASSWLTPRILLLAFISVLPFWSIPVTHLLSGADSATGFYQYELPYYVANGRAAFERGTGVTYPNPYDPADDSPSIYGHWFPWTLGFLTAVTGFEPGDVLLSAGFFLSLTFAVATYHLVATRSLDSGGPPQDSLFLLVMWGGGLLAGCGLLFPSRALDGWADQVLRFDPGQGMWFLNWGRNALFPTETLYHSLVAVCWMAEIRGRCKWANACLILLGTTHPWSGLQLLLTITSWRFLLWAADTFRPAPPYISDRSAGKADRVSHDKEFNRVAVGANRNQLVVSISLLSLFLLYYKVWLPSFPSHSKLENVWELDWSLPTLSAVLAYGLVAVPAGIILWRMRQNAGRSVSTQFLAVALFVSLGLAFHDRLVKPVQPLHFTRGYLWMPLFLLGLPVIREWIQRFRSVFGSLAMSAVFALLMLDNIAFCSVHALRQWRHEDGFHLHADERALMQVLHSNAETRGRVVLTESETINYLLPTYAAVRPWLGHHFNTPDFHERRSCWEACFEDHQVCLEAIPEDVDILAVRRTTNDLQLVRSVQWKAIRVSNAGWSVWQRVAETD